MAGSSGRTEDVGRVPMLLQDRGYLMGDTDAEMLVRPATYVEVRDGRLRDGPASDRVAVADGEPPARARVRLLAPAGARRVRAFAFDDQLLDPDATDATRFEDEAFVQLHVFGCVHATLAFFEQLLGRRVRWAFPARRLALVPWAGTGGNAAYQRETASLRFERYTTPKGRNILFALSSDIVAHETGHAILDAVAPDLYDATDPDSLTLHEAVGDLAAVLQTLLDEAVVFSSAALFGGDVDPLEALGRIGEEVGTDLGRRQGATALRDASSTAAFRSEDPDASIVDRSDAHAASTVLVSSLFAALRDRVGNRGRDMERDIAVAARELARFAIPALNRLPPGEVSLSDYARALGSAAAETSTGPTWMRTILRQLVDRGVTSDASSLVAAIPTPDPLARWPGTPARLVEANRERLGVPADVTPESEVVEFEDRTWTTRPRKRRALRIAWDIEEEHDVGAGLSDLWLFRTGTTAVVDAETGVPVSILTGDQGRDVWARRDAQLHRWAAAGLLGEQQGLGVLGRTEDGRQRVAGTARTLHVLRPKQAQRSTPGRPRRKGPR